jgi:hypothetical protein
MRFNCPGKSSTCTSLLTAAMLLVPGVATAQNVRIAYDPQGTVALGSTLNILNYGQALADCIAYDEKDLKFDTAGATKTRIKISLASSYDELMNDVSKDLTLTSTGSLGVPGVKGDVDLNLSVKKTDYDKSVERSLLIGLTARSEYGRQYIPHYDLKTPFKQKVAAKAWSDLSTCGTHFVRAETRVSQLTLVISITGLDHSSKSTLVSSFKNTSKTTLNVGDIGGSTSNSITANLTSVVELAKRVGTVSLDYIAVGGPGISGAGDTLKTNEPENIKALLEGLAAASKEFKQDNSAPEKMLLIPMTVFGIPATPVDYTRLQKLVKLRQHSADVDAQIQVLEDYKGKDDAVFAKYFVDSLAKLQVLNALLTASIATCSSGGSCDDTTKNPDIAFMEDVFVDSKTELSCRYSNDIERYDFKGNRVKISLIDNATVNLTGKLRFSDQIDLDSVKIIRLNLDTGKAEDRTSTGLNGISLSDPDPATQARKAFASIDYESFSSISGQAKTLSFAQLTEKLTAARRALTGSTYLVEFPTRLWIPKLTVAVGIPDGSKCPVSQSAPIK